MTKIEWAEKTWNPIVGCSKVSPACDNCYAEGMAARLAAMPQTPWYSHVIDNRKWNGGTVLVDHALEQPLQWKKPRRIFVGSMTDMFHETVNFEWLDKVFAVMALCPQHTFMLLTKRPERMREYILNPSRKVSFVRKYGCWPLSNVWLGVTVENQEQADKRIPVLLDTPAVEHFVSIEPMLGAVDISEYVDGTRWVLSEKMMVYPLSWVICGGESGPNARPMHPDWVRALRDQCVKSGTPFFFKQWGEWVQRDHRIHGNTPRQAVVRLGEHGRDTQGLANCTDDMGNEVYIQRVGKKTAGHLLDGVEWFQVPEASND